MVCTSHQILLGCPVKKNWIDGACGILGEGRDVYWVLMGKLKDARPVRIILKWVFKKYVRMRTVLISLRIGINDDFCENVNEIPRTIKYREFIE